MWEAEELINIEDKIIGCISEITYDVGFLSAHCEYILLQLVKTEAILTNGLVKSGGKS